MFARKPLPGITELYDEQKSRNGDYAQTFEYFTLEADNRNALDLELAGHARSGWEVEGFSVARNASQTAVFYVLMRRPVKPPKDR